MREIIRKVDARILQSDTSHDISLPDGSGVVVSIARAKRIRTEDGGVEREPRIGIVSNQLDSDPNRVDGSLIPVGFTSELQMFAAMERREIDLLLTTDPKLADALQETFPVLLRHENGAAMVARKVIPKQA